MKKQDNELLTRIEDGAPMGAFLRQYWTPAVRSQAVVADGAPVRFRLFGEDFVAFRATDGRVGVLDEACPHRGVSLALARNEDNGLRCIFHGWKMEVGGGVVDAPCEPEIRRAQFCATIRVARYQAREAAGVVWVYVGDGEPPAFPDFEFMSLPAEQVLIRRAVVKYNWLQGLEAHIDASHVPVLHHGSLTRGNSQVEASQRASLSLLLLDKVPRLEIEERPYGFREGQTRSAGEGKTSVRIREVALPFFTFIPGPPGKQCSARVSVPIDNETSAEWYILYDPHGPLSPAAISGLFHGTSDDPDDFASDLGDVANLWHQDRQAMKDGHFSGITRNLSYEDFVVQASMGRRFDRSTEQLGSADALIVRVRKMLLDAVHAFEDGSVPRWREGFDYGGIRARAAVVDEGTDWRRAGLDQTSAS